MAESANGVLAETADLVMRKQVLRSLDPGDVMKRRRSRHTRQRPLRKQCRDQGNRRKVKEDASTLYERRTQYSHSTESHVEQEQELIQLPDSSNATRVKGSEGQTTSERESND